MWSSWVLILCMVPAGVGGGVRGVSFATHGQTDMRGLVTAGPDVRRECSACLESERHHCSAEKHCRPVLSCYSQLDRESLRPLPVTVASSRRQSMRRDRSGLAWSWRCSRCVVHHSQRPAPSGQFPGHTDRGDGGSLVACVAGPPRLVQPAVRLIGTGPYRRWLPVAATNHLRRQSIRFAVMP